MRSLSDLDAYLQDRWAVLADTERRLCELQQKFETFFAEVCRVREGELEQLQEHILADRAGLPRWLDEQLVSAQAEVEQELETKLVSLRSRLDELVGQAEDVRAASRHDETRVKAGNRALDGEEERLKERNHQLLERITLYNERIRELGHGFGFFANLLKMRSLVKQRRVLDEEAADVAARIEALRGRWQRVDEKFATAEQERRQQWIDRESEAATCAAELEALTRNRAKILRRSTLERVLERLQREPEPASEGDPSCPRCGSGNAPAQHFCHICAQRLGEDRPDLEGSLEEISELNGHHHSFADGMKACQEIIGLVRGLRSGVESFAKSVVDMESTESRYPLPALLIEVPAQSLRFGARFDELRDAVGADQSLHPKQFAEEVSRLISETLTEGAITRYFELMGEELTRQAATQWD